MTLYRRLVTTAIAILLVAATPAHSQTLQDKLYQRALKGTKCEEVPNNGRYCTYSFGDTLSIGIKDVGGSDTVVGFHNSNIKNELYAVLYFGCVVVVPGKSHPDNYSKDYGVSISPKTGFVYKTTTECKASL